MKFWIDDNHNDAYIILAVKLQLDDVRHMHDDMELAVLGIGAENHIITVNHYGWCRIYGVKTQRITIDIVLENICINNIKVRWCSKNYFLVI